MKEVSLRFSINNTDITVIYLREIELLYEIVIKLVLIM